MAEKRIEVKVVDGECEHLWFKDAEQGFPYGAKNPINNYYCAVEVDFLKSNRSEKTKRINPNKDCKNCARAYYHGMTRQEAIEKMNKATCKANKRCIGGICETCTSKMPHEEYTHQNEAALNALLEVEK